MDRKSVVPVMGALVAFLSVSTMLRFPGLPVGVSEVIVFVTALVFVFCRRSELLQNLKHPLMLFWGAFITTAVIGNLTGTVRGEATVHTGGAYLYAAGFTLIVLTYVDDLNQAEFQRFIRALSTIPILLLSIPLLVFFIGSDWLSDLLEINTSFYPSRVAAWSMNPNQLALFLLPVPIWLAAISQNSHWKGWRFFKKFFFLWFVFFLGFCVRSDALLLAWAVGIPFLTVVAWHWLKKVNWKFFATLIATFLLAFASFKFFFDGAGQRIFEVVRAEVSQKMSSAVLPVASDHDRNVDKAPVSKSTGAVFELVERLEHRASPTTEAPVPPAFGKSDSTIGIGMDPNKAGVRKTLWIHAFEVWKLSPVVGHGPGAFSYLDSPNERQEAHNLLLDLLTQVGIVGVAFFAVVYLWLVVGAIKARDPYSITLLVILMLFSGAHFMLRQPVFTLYMVICAVVIKKRLFEQVSEEQESIKVLQSGRR
ncbi:O-antigen ligase family protein [Pseudomonas chlororaphis subsp. aurantiaca]|uniref:O-antigen ligase family protein n=1 Tax=Pseudomonas chlororaphis TaxID=587753 RepID=UPI0027DC55EF|nr:O-antigen ligase family protein [Pseudomonas chlororaphis]WMI98294.1 O-antigen ligase family protein [Pseudomonas chlororaphis subsp. aurantiaca]